jgi:hypothetical protein
MENFPLKLSVWVSKDSSKNESSFVDVTMNLVKVKFITRRGK